MLLRRTAATLAVTAVLGMGGVGAPAAVAEESPTPHAPEQKLPPGLYGTGDPQYDGVFRQAIAMLAQKAVGVEPAKQAVNWLAEQQCEGGSFTAYRADSSEPCGDGSAQSTADTNATAIAVQALAVLGGHSKVVDSGVGWLKLAQNKDGGWGYQAGAPTDANSTALAVGAFTAVGVEPQQVRSRDGDQNPYEALDGLQLGCDADSAERGAFAYQPDEGGDGLTANDAATVAAALAADGSGMSTVADQEHESPEESKSAEVSPPSCDDDGRFARKDSAQAASAYLASALEKNKGYLLSVMPGAEDQPDHGNTTLAALALGADGHPEAAQASLNWLARNLTDWEGVNKQPAALGQLVLAVHANGGDPTDFGGENLVKQLNATGPTPEQDEPQDTASEDGDDDSSNGPLIVIIAVGVLAGVGAGVLLSLKKKSKDS